MDVWVDCRLLLGRQVLGGWTCKATGDDLLGAPAARLTRAPPLPRHLYLEGSDSTAGLVQSSLLHVVAVNARPPTNGSHHGFTLDDEGSQEAIPGQWFGSIGVTD